MATESFLVANEPQNVTQITQQAPPRFAPVIDHPAGPGEKDVTPSLLEMARAIAAICGTRVLLLLAVLFSGVALIWTMYDPSNLRIVGATAYAAVTVLPLTALYWRKG